MRYRAILLSAAAIMVLPEAAFAQAETTQNSNDSSATDSAKPDSQGLAEIVVTAQRRAQNMQNVPVAVTAISGDELVSHNVSTISDLPQLAPSLTVTPGNIPTNSSINIRGVGTVAFSTAVEPSVAVIVDDVPLLQQAQAFSGLSDVERIEILRGPQGTLFGKNASAGVINIVSKGPTDYLSGSIMGTATTDQEYRIDGSISGPVTQDIGIRLNGFYGDREGYIHNLTDGSWLNGDKSWGLRAYLKIRPTNNLTIDLIGSHSESQTNGSARPFIAVPPGATVYGTPVATSLAGITPGLDNYQIRTDSPFFNKSYQTTVSGKASLDLGAASLMSITSYQKWNFRFTEDFDELAAPVIGLPKGIVAGSTYQAHLWTQELRLVSNSQGMFEYIAGLYYANGETSREFTRGPSGPALAHWASSNGTETKAAYAQVTYNISPQTHLDGGLRYNHEKIDVAFQNLIPSATPPANNATCLAVCAGNSSEDQVTGKIALRQDLDQHVMAYASYATGYKGQGYDISTGFTPDRVVKPVGAEHSKAYEVGLKSRFFDGKVQLNLAGFWTDYNGFQAQSGVQLPDGTFQIELSNVGKVRTRGVEVELSALPAKHFRIDGAFSYVDAKIISFPNAQCYTGQTVALGCVDLDGSGPGTTMGQNLAGKGLPNAPKYKFNIGANYDIPLADMPFDAFVRADLSYKSKVNFSLLGDPLTVQDGYAIVNASFGIKPAADRGINVTFFVNNLFDKHYAAYVNTASGGPVGLLTANLPRDSRRYAGLRVRYSF